MIAPADLISPNRWVNCGILITNLSMFCQRSPNSICVIVFTQVDYSFLKKNGSQILVPMTMISISPNGHDSWLQVGSKLLDRWCWRGWLVKIFLVTKTLPETDWKRTCIEMFLPKGLDFATYQLPQKKTLFPKRKCVYFPTYWCSGGRKNVALSGRRRVFLWQKSGCLKLCNNRMKRASETQVR